MRVFLINLDRQAWRLEPMTKLLGEVPFIRIAAIDGKNLPGLERRDPNKPHSRENISRYEVACIESHREAWRTFLATSEPFCCVLEDDLFLSDEFLQYVRDETWIPKDADLIKVETHNDPVF